jgi:hypothetical protein
MGIFEFGSTVEPKNLLEGLHQSSVILVSLERFDLQREGVVVVNRVGVVIHQDHFFFDAEGLLQVLKILHQLSLHFSAGFPVESPLNVLVFGIQHSENRISVVLAARRVNVDRENLGGGLQELLGQWARLNIHDFSIELSEWIYT